MRRKAEGGVRSFLALDWAAHKKLPGPVDPLNATSTEFFLACVLHVPSRTSCPVY